MAIGRNVRAGRMMIIDEDAPLFSVTEALGGKLIRLAIPSASTADPACNYGLQLAATMLSDDRTVACGDQASRDLLALACRVAKTDVTVFINGPTGTGKEVLAKFIHNHSERADAPFVAVNCAAIPDNMLEAILFGHEAFGARPRTRVSSAPRTAEPFLDEISEMPMALQAASCSSGKGRHPDWVPDRYPGGCQGCCNPNRNMSEEIRLGNFREDLYRLNVFPLNTVTLDPHRRCRAGRHLPCIVMSVTRRHALARSERDYSASRIWLAGKCPGTGKCFAARPGAG